MDRKQQKGAHRKDEVAPADARILEPGSEVTKPIPNGAESDGIGLAQERTEPVEPASEVEFGFSDQEAQDVNRTVRCPSESSAPNQIARGEQARLDLDCEPPPQIAEAGAPDGGSGGRTDLPEREVAAANVDGAEIAFEHAHASILSGISVGVRPDMLRSRDGNDLFLPAKMSRIPWAVLESFYRAFWIIVAAALDVPREAVKFVCGERIVGKQLHSAASYRLSAEDAARLTDPEVRSRLEVGIALMAEQKLWISVDLQSLYPSLPWQEMLEPVRQARDEIKAKRLPCQVAGDIKVAGMSFVLGPDLAPQRPAKESKRDVTEVGHSNGFRYRYDHKLHFAKNDGNPPVDITFPEEPFLDKVMSVTRRDPPWIEVEYEEARHDDVVVSRVMLTLEIKQESLK